MADSSSSEIIKLILWTTDKLLQLMGLDYQTGKDRYENIFSPAFLAMQEIHENYISLINKVIELLPTDIDEKYAYINEFDRDLKITKYGVKVEIGSDKYLQNKLASIELVLRERKLNNNARIDARTNSAEIIKKAHNKFEKRFCWAVINYFLGQSIFEDKVAEEEFLERLKTQGFHQQINTPSVLIKDKLLSENDTKKSKDYLIQVKRSLDQGFLEITHAYGHLKRNTYK